VCYGVYRLAGTPATAQLRTTAAGRPRGAGCCAAHRDGVPARVAGGTRSPRWQARNRRCARASCAGRRSRGVADGVPLTAALPGRRSARPGAADRGPRERSPLPPRSGLVCPVGGAGVRRPRVPRQPRVTASRPRAAQLAHRAGLDDDLCHRSADTVRPRGADCADLAGAADSGRLSCAAQRRGVNLPRLSLNRSQEQRCRQVRRRGYASSL